MTLKKCAKCQEIKELSNYHKLKYGFMKICKECTKIIRNQLIHNS